MNSIVVSNIVRFVGLVLLQVSLLQRIPQEMPVFPYTHVLVYPLIVLLLPIKTPRWAQFGIAFSAGIIVDIFYNSPGAHAGALVFCAYLRPYMLRALEPSGGYNLSYSPTRKRMGLPWFARYVSIMMLFHLTSYFTLHAFSFLSWKEILLNTFFGFNFSMGFILLLSFIFNPTD